MRALTSFQPNFDDRHNFAPSSHGCASRVAASKCLLDRLQHFTPSISITLNAPIILKHRYLLFGHWMQPHRSIHCRANDSLNAFLGGLMAPAISQNLMVDERRLSAIPKVIFAIGFTDNGATTSKSAPQRSLVCIILAPRIYGRTHSSWSRSTPSKLKIFVGTSRMTTRHFIQQGTFQRP